MDYNENAQKSKVVSLRCGEAASGIPFGMTEVSRDFILPDLYADIKRILAVTGTLSPTTGYTDGGKAFFGGDLTFRVLFVTDEGEARSVSFPAEYEGQVTVGGSESALRTLFLPTLETVSARSVNPRKIGIKAKINPGIYAWEDRDASVSFPESMTAADRMSFEEKNEEIAHAVMKYLTVSGVESGDDIRLDDGAFPIREILSTDVSFSKISAEAREGAVAVNASADITMVYIADDPAEEKGRLSFLSHTVPVSCLLESTEAAEGDACHAALYAEKVTCVPAENAAGEARIAELDFSYTAAVALEKNEKVMVVRDLYSTLYECENDTCELRTSRYLGKAAFPVKCRGEIKFKEEGEVVGAFSAVRIISGTKNEAGSGEVSGLVSTAVVIREADGSLVSETVEAPFTADTGLSFGDKSEWLCRAAPEKTKAVLSGGSLVVDSSLSLSVMAWENRRDRVIASATVTAECADEGDRTFTVYYPAADETVWDIAKKYRVTRNSLILANGEFGKGGEGRRALIIPKKKKAIFGGVIS